MTVISATFLLTGEYVIRASKGAIDEAGAPSYLPHDLLDGEGLREIANVGVFARSFFVRILERRILPPRLRLSRPTVHLGEPAELGLVLHASFSRNAIEPEELGVT
jgi:hypothetical protein